MIPRYSRKEISKIWEAKNKYQIWLDIEILICEALNKFWRDFRFILKKYQEKS